MSKRIREKPIVQRVRLEVKKEDLKGVKRVGDFKECDNIGEFTGRIEPILPEPFPEPVQPPRTDIAPPPRRILKLGIPQPRYLADLTFQKEAMREKVKSVLGDINLDAMRNAEPNGGGITNDGDFGSFGVGAGAGGGGTEQKPNILPLLIIGAVVVLLFAVAG